MDMPEGKGFAEYAVYVQGKDGNDDSSDAILVV
jgi:hypothetical protein